MKCVSFAAFSSWIFMGFSVFAFGGNLSPAELLECRAHVGVWADNLCPPEYYNNSGSGSGNTFNGTTCYDHLYGFSPYAATGNPPQCKPGDKTYLDTPVAPAAPMATPPVCTQNYGCPYGQEGQRVDKNYMDSVLLGGTASSDIEMAYDRIVSDIKNYEGPNNCKIRKNDLLKILAIFQDVKVAEGELASATAATGGEANTTAFAQADATNNSGLSNNQLRKQAILNASKCVGALEADFNKQAPNKSQQPVCLVKNPLLERVLTDLKQAMGGAVSGDAMMLLNSEEMKFQNSNMQ